jgi:hypothetical protein
VQQKVITARGETDPTGLRIGIDDGESELEVGVRGGGTAAGFAGDPAAALGLLTAMATGRTLTVSQPVSPRLCAGLLEIQRAFSAWSPGLRRVEIEAEPRPGRPGAAGRGTASFFSGGVDSFYSLLEHERDLTHLIVIHGFDLRLDEIQLREAVSAMASRVAVDRGLELVEVETDARLAVDPHLNWSMAHGFVLATVGLSLQKRFERILIPASYTFDSMFPWGTHPLIDPLWSTEDVEFGHDGFGVDRLEKLERISDSEIALANLRVCWENRDDEYNCGRCEKCVRTMISLAAIDALDRCSAFARPLRPEAVASLPLFTRPVRSFAIQNLRVLERSGARPDIAEALRRGLRRSSGVRGVFRRNLLRGRRIARRAVR